MAIERGYVMVKPVAFKNNHVGGIINKIEKAGFDILAIKTVTLTKKLAKQFYGIHKERPFFGELIEFMTSGKVVAICVEKENSIEDMRTLVGNTDPAKAEAGTIRIEFGTDIQANGIHASDSVENGLIESSFFFSNVELV